MSKKLTYLACFVLLLSLTASFASAGPAGHWTFDEGVGDVAHDSSGNNNDGTLQGNPVWVTGRIGSGALSFDNTDDIVIVGDDPSLDLEDELTITLWVKAPDVVTPNHMVTKQPSGTAPDNYPGNYEFRIKDDTIQFLHQTSEGTDYSEYHSTSQITAGEWHHAAMTVVEGDLVEFYLDGVPAGSTAQLGTFGMLNDEPLRIGGRKDDRFFNGILDDVYIYDRALTAHQIEGLSNGIEPMFTKAERPAPEDGVLHAETWVNLGWHAGEFAVSHDVYLGDNFDDVSDGVENTFQGNQSGTSLIVGFPGFAYPDGLVPGTTYYWRIDEVNDTEPNSPWKGNIWSFSVPPKTAYWPDPADAAESVDPDVQLSWTAGFGSKLHTVYFGDSFDDVNNATGNLPQGATTYTPGPLKLAKTYYWRVDEFDAIDTYKGDVWSFTTQGAVGSPDPANGAADVEQTPVLTWTPGVYGASHEVYFGTDKDAVENADTSSPEYKGIGALGSESYNPGKLQWYTTYYWRIDEVNNVNPDSPWKGNVWNFTTVDFIVIEDFEDYNDYPPDEIFSTWIDGYGTTTNGSTAGYAEPDWNAGEHYVETSIVHGGGQSMPLFYDNNFKYSEATITLVSVRDWTEEGVGVLSLWFRGDASNAAERMYVALNGNAVVYHDNPNAAQINTWTEWTIDLQEFAAQGVNLANVNTISIGFGDKNNLQAGSSGMVFFDDIRLYRPAQ